MTDMDWEWVEMRAAELYARVRAANGWIDQEGCSLDERSGCKSWLLGTEPYHWTRETHAGYLAAAAIYG